MITAEVPEFFDLFEDVIAWGTCSIPLYFLRTNGQYLVVFLMGGANQSYVGLGRPLILTQFD